MSDNKWINNAPRTETTFNTVCCFNSQISELATSISASNIITNSITGDYSKWLSNIICYPFKTTLKGTTGKFYYGSTDTNIDCVAMISQTDYYEHGFTLGQYYYSATYNDFRDFEPYTQLEVYLPYYGFVEVKIADVIGKYIQFRLFVDFKTGQAQYLIGVSNNSITSRDAPFRNETDDSIIRTLSTHTFQIGVNIPIGTTGMAETVRNIAMGVVKGSANIGASYVVEKGGLSKTTSVEKTVTTVRNPQTGRQVTSRTRTTTTDTDRSNYRKAERVNEAFDTAAECLQNLSLRPQSDKSNNCALGGISYSVQIVKRSAKFITAGTDYNKLYGKPLGDIRQLSTLTGYTEISAIHLEGVGFGTATQKELAMLEQILSDGIIL